MFRYNPFTYVPRYTYKIDLNWDQTDQAEDRYIEKHHALILPSHCRGNT